MIMLYVLLLYHFIFVKLENKFMRSKFIHFVESYISPHFHSMKLICVHFGTPYPTKLCPCMTALVSAAYQPSHVMAGWTARWVAYIFYCTVHSLGLDRLSTPVGKLEKTFQKGCKRDQFYICQVWGFLIWMRGDSQIHQV